MYLWGKHLRVCVYCGRLFLNLRNSSMCYRCTELQSYKLQMLSKGPTLQVWKSLFQIDLVFLLWVWKVGVFHGQNLSLEIFCIYFGSSVIWNKGGKHLVSVHMYGGGIMHFKVIFQIKMKLINAITTRGNVTSWHCFLFKLKMWQPLFLPCLIM